MSDTPRTDAALQKAWDFEREWVFPDTARQLERELNEAKRDLAQACEIAKHLLGCKENWQKLAEKRENETLQAVRSTRVFRKYCDKWKMIANGLESQLDEAKAELSAITADRDKEAERINKLEILISRDWIELREDNHQIALLMNFSRIQADDLRAVLDKINL